MTVIKSTNQLLDYKDFVKYSDEFYETGAAAGDGIQRALDAGFDMVTSIEASKEYFEICRKRFSGKQLKVFLRHGKSVDILSLMLTKNNVRIPSVFYLDAHVSGETSAGYEDWIENGEESEYAQDKTIKLELAIILAHSNKHVIIIDDVNGIADGHAHEYAAIMQAANPDYKFYFYDECLSGDAQYFYHEKLLVAIPN